MIKSDGDYVEIYRTRQGAVPVLVGRLNRAGRTIVEGLDGKHTIEDLARDLLAVSGRPPQSAESAAGTVAAFVAELAAAGLLATPFYATIERAEFTA